MKKVFKKMGISLKLSPSFFIVLIKVLGIVMVWRGVWGILDKYLFPENPVLSYTISIALGLFVLYLPDGEIDSLV